MNKTELVDALAERFDGNRRKAEKALEAVLDTITREVSRGEKVSITGFGSFEKRTRNARWVRNPQTGERMKSKKKDVPKFSAGQHFKDVTSGAKKLAALPKAAKPRADSARATASKTASKSGSTAKAAAKKTTGAAKKAARR